MRRWSVAVLLSLTVLTAAAATMQAGAAKLSIAPQSAMWRTGYAGGDRPAQAADSSLFARALAIDDGAGNRVVILSVELLAVPRTLAERVAIALMKTYDLERGQIVISATGTHSAPFVQGLYPVRAPAGAIEQRAIAEYTDTVARALFDAASAALTDMQPARLSFTAGQSAFAATVPLSGAAGAEKPDKPGNPRVPVLRVTARDGRLLATVFGYARRNAALDGSSCAPGDDYAGLAAAAIEGDVPGSVALFLQLCDDGQPPVLRGSTDTAPHPGATLAKEVEHALRSPMQPVTGRLRASLMETSLPFAPHTREQFEVEARSPDPVIARHGRMILAAYEARLEPRQLPYPVQVIRCGKSFALIALGGELDAAYAPKIRARVARQNLLIADGSNDGGYVVPVSEGQGSANADVAASIVDSGLPCAFTGEAEERILNAVERAWKRLGK